MSQSTPRVVITIIGPQGSGKGLLAEKLRLFLSWIGIENIKITERLP